MAELTVKSGKGEEKTIAADIGTAGIHIFVDKDYFDRRGEVSTHFDFEQGEIETLGMSDKKKLMFERTVKVLGFVSTQGTSGRGGDNGRFYKAMTACRNLCQRNMEDLLYSDATDDEVGVICLDRMAKVEQIIHATFREDNTSILKAFTVQGPMQTPMQGPVMTPVQQLQQNSQKPDRGGTGEYAGRNPPQR